MTVRRSESRTYPGPPVEVTERIEVAFNRSPRFRKVHRDAFQIMARYRPLLWPLMYSTALTVTIIPTATRSLVEITTRSHWWVGADIFRYFDRLIPRIFSVIEAGLAGDRP